MPDHVSKTLAAAVATRLALILTTGTYAPGGSGSESYKTNAGNNVSSWRDLDSAPWTHDDNFPAINVRDVGADDDEGTMGIALHYHRINFECDIAAGTIDTLRNMAGDIYGAVFSDEKWSAAANRTDWQGYTLDTTHAENKLFGGVVRFAILTKTARGNPYG